MTESAAGTAVTTTAADPTPAQKLSAEVAGTFVLVFFGVGTALATGGEVITTGFAFGLTVLVMVYSVGRVSGGHFNPAVTVGAACGGRLAWAQVPAYLGAQLVGAIVGAAVLWTIWQGIPGFSSEGNFGQNAYGDESGLGHQLVGGLPRRGGHDAGLPGGHPRGDRRAQRAPRPGPAGHRVHARDDPLRHDPADRHVGEPRPLDRPRALRRQRRDHPAVAVHPRPAHRRRACRPPVPGALRPPRRAGRGFRPAVRRSYAARGGPRLRRARRLPAAVEPAVPPGPGAATRSALAARRAAAVAAAAVPDRAAAPQSWPPAAPAAAAAAQQQQPPAQPPQAAPYQQPWPGNDDDGQTQVRPPT